MPHRNASLAISFASAGVSVSSALVPARGVRIIATSKTAWIRVVFIFIMSFPFDNGWRIGDLLPTASTARPANHWLFLTRVKDGYAERNRQRPCRLLYRCDS